jgi:hypothetical protein
LFGEKKLNLPRRFRQFRDGTLSHDPLGDIFATLDAVMDKGEASELLQRGTEWLAEEQDMLYAQDRWSLLLLFQASPPPCSEPCAVPSPPMP